MKFPKIKFPNLFGRVKDKFFSVKDKIKTHKEKKSFITKIEQDLQEKKKRKQSIRNTIDNIEKGFIKVKDKKKKRTKYSLKLYLEKAGFSIQPNLVSKRIFNLCLIVNLLLSAYIIYHFSMNYNYTLYYALMNMLLMWTGVFLFILVVVWISFHVILDLRIFHRKVTLETVLPDFLQLTSANIRAGMPIDQSLWYAVRPRFGILAKEIEVVAKETASGKELKEALIDFTAKYNSPTLTRSFNLLIEGMDAGGEVGDLLNKISINIQDNEMMKKEMSANVTTYAIFIGFAALAGAPFLFALAGHLLNIMVSLTSELSIPTGMAISISGVGITMADFRIYSIVSLFLTSLFSSMIVAIILKGSIKAGFKYIPMFIFASFFVYSVAYFGLNMIFSSVF